MKRLVGPKIISKLTGVHPTTIRKYADMGKIRCYKNEETGYRRFKPREAIEDLKKLNLISNGS